MRRPKQTFPIAWKFQWNQYNLGQEINIKDKREDFQKSACDPEIKIQYHAWNTTKSYF